MLENVKATVNSPMKLPNHSSTGISEQIKTDDQKKRACTLRVQVGHVEPKVYHDLLVFNFIECQSHGLMENYGNQFSKWWSRCMCVR